MGRSYNFTVPAPARPVISDELIDIERLKSWIDDENDGDAFASRVRLVGDGGVNVDFSSLELAGSCVEDCAYASCDFTRGSFDDVVFSGCDFSNCDFSQASFARCTFAACKFTGANFTEASLHRVELRDSTVSYAAFTKALFEDVNAVTCDFSHTDIAEARFRRTAFDDVRFVGTNFFRTSLAGIDVTTCQLADIVLSDDMSELRGCRMDLYQAAGIAQRLGVVVKD